VDEGGGSVPPFLHLLERRIYVVKEEWGQEIEVIVPDRG